MADNDSAVPTTVSIFQSKNTPNDPFSEIAKHTPHGADGQCRQPYNHRGDECHRVSFVSSSTAHKLDCRASLA